MRDSKDWRIGPKAYARRKFCSRSCAARRSPCRTRDVPIDVTLIQYLDHFVNKAGGPDACWPIASRFIVRSGYALFAFRGVRYSAHRAVMLAETGSLPRHIHVRHTCFNRACCNPRHLVKCSIKERWAIEKRRYGKREKGQPRRRTKLRSPRAALSDAQVAAMRAMAEAGTREWRTLAEHFAVCKTTVYRVLGHYGMYHA